MWLSWPGHVHDVFLNNFASLEQVCCCQVHCTSLLTAANQSRAGSHTRMAPEKDAFFAHNYIQEQLDCGSTLQSDILIAVL